MLRRIKAESQILIAFEVMNRGMDPANYHSVSSTDSEPEHVPLTHMSGEPGSAVVKIISNAWVQIHAS